MATNPPLQRLLPLDRLDSVLMPIVHRFSNEELVQLEELVFAAPLARIMGVMQIASVAARRSQDVRRCLAVPGVLDLMKSEALRRRDQAATPAAKPATTA